MKTIIERVISLNNLNYTIKKEKNKHLKMEHYQKIQSEYNHYMSLKDKPEGKTSFMKKLAKLINTSLSNLYEIIDSGITQVLDYNLNYRYEFSAQVAYEKRTTKSVESNASKRLSSKEFVSLVIHEFRSNYNIDSIDCIINDLKQNRSSEIEGLETICTTTFYNYVKDGKIEGFSKTELPMYGKRKEKNDENKGKSDPKGISIENRPFEPEDRSEFGHWEGDTIVGSNNIKNSGAVLTLVERQTRFQMVVKLKDRKAKTVRKAFYKLKKLYPDYDIKQIFKSITFDNGVEFSLWANIAKYLGTTIYFAHPYSSWERGSNENCNKLLRIFLPKSCNINAYSEEYIMNANELINMKIRKIFSYKSSLELFNIEVAKLPQTI